MARSVSWRPSAVLNPFRAPASFPVNSRSRLSTQVTADDTFALQCFCSWDTQDHRGTPNARQEKCRCTTNTPPLKVSRCSNACRACCKGVLHVLLREGMHLLTLRKQKQVMHVTVTSKAARVSL